VIVTPTCTLTFFGVDQTNNKIDSFVEYKVTETGSHQFAFDFEPADECIYEKDYAVTVDGQPNPYDWITVNKDGLYPTLELQTDDIIYEGYYSIQLSCYVNHIPRISSWETIDFVLALSKDPCQVLQFDY